MNEQDASLTCYESLGAEHFADSVLSPDFVSGLSERETQVCPLYQEDATDFNKRPIEEPDAQEETDRRKRIQLENLLDRDPFDSNLFQFVDEKHTTQTDVPDDPSDRYTVTEPIQSYSFIAEAVERKERDMQLTEAKIYEHCTFEEVGWNPSAVTFHAVIRESGTVATAIMNATGDADSDVAQVVRLFRDSGCTASLFKYDDQVLGRRRLSAKYASEADELEIRRRRSIDRLKLIAFYKSRSNRSHLYMQLIRSIIANGTGPDDLREKLARATERLISNGQEHPTMEDVFFEMILMDGYVSCLFMRLARQLYFLPPSYTDIPLYCKNEECKQVVLCPLWCLHCGGKAVSVMNQAVIDNFTNGTEDIRHIQFAFDAIAATFGASAFNSRRGVFSTSAFLLSSAAISIGEPLMKASLKKLAKSLFSNNERRGLGTLGVFKQRWTAASPDFVFKSYVEHIVSGTWLRELGYNSIKEHGSPCSNTKGRLAQVERREIFGFEPGSVSKLDVPVSCKRYCSTCGCMRNKVERRLVSDDGKTETMIVQLPPTKGPYLIMDELNMDETQFYCSKCKNPLEKQIWFKDFTNLLSWPFVFEKAGIPLTDNQPHFNRRHITTKAVVFLARKARPYQSLERLGRLNYYHQCYFVTHLVLVASEYGTRSIADRSAFIEEHSFMSNAMDYAIKTKDVELVGEFCFCLKILADHPGNNMALANGMTFLRKSLANMDEVEAWVRFADDLEKRIHILYCIITGLFMHRRDLPSHDISTWADF